MLVNPSPSTATRSAPVSGGLTTPALVEQLMSQIEAMQSELDKLREQSDARRYHMEQVEQELRLASRLQRDFLPKTLPNQGRVKFNRLYLPAGHVSGDLYDVRRLDEHHAGVYLADAIGHGMPAALLAMFMHNALQTKRIDPDGFYRLLTSAEAMQHLNETLGNKGLANATFATAVYAKVDCDAGRVEFARGGHPLPMVLRGKGKATTIEEIGGEGALLGVMPDEVFEPCTIVLRPGERMIFFTDGVETAFVREGQAPDLDAWRRAIRERCYLSADAMVADLTLALEGKKPTDDVTVVTLEMT